MKEEKKKRSRAWINFIFFLSFFYSCWIEESKYTWIIQGPVVISMVLNFFFLVNIVRVLVTKLRETSTLSHSCARADNHQIRKAVRATLILIPLLGLQYVLMPFRPPPGSPGENIYEVAAAIFTSLQGLAVALLFCFFNGEVINVLKRYFVETCTHPIQSLFSQCSVNVYASNHTNHTMITTPLPAATTNNATASVNNNNCTHNTLQLHCGHLDAAATTPETSPGNCGHSKQLSSVKASPKYSPSTTASTIV